MLDSPLLAPIMFTFSPILQLRTSHLGHLTDGHLTIWSFNQSQDQPS